MGPSRRRGQEKWVVVVGVGVVVGCHRWTQMGISSCKKNPCITTRLDLLNCKGCMNESELGWVHEMRGRWSVNYIEGFDIIHFDFNSISMCATALGPKYRVMEAVEVGRTLLP
jgi:hypothetical protein